MSAIALADMPVETTGPAQRLRRQAAAVRVHFTWWGVHKTLSAQQRAEVSDAYGADARLLSAGKKILDVRHEAFRQLTSIRTRIVHYWRSLTLPFVEAGVRLIRQADISSFAHTLEGFRDELVQAECDLNAVYESMKADAQGRLGRLYNPADYPSEVRGLFAVGWDFPSIEPPSYLMRLHPEIYRLEQERVAHRFEEAVRLAEQAFATELARLVAHLSERLAADDNGQRRVFRDSAVSNLLEFFERFRRLNVRSNDELDQLVDQAQNLVRGVTPEGLRVDADLRQQVGGALQQVQSQLDALIVDRPRRQIIRSSLARIGGEHADRH